jgi:hypothetical protein
MIFKRATFALIAVAIGLGPARGAWAAADVLDAIPSGALAVVLINRLEATSDKIEALATKIQAPSVSLLMLARVQTGIHEGLDEKATAALALLPSENFPLEPAIPIIVLPVTDYAKFVAQLQPDDATEKITQVYVAGKPALTCQKGDFAVLTGPENQSALDDVLSSVKSVSEALSPLRTWLSEVDAAAIATPAAIKSLGNLARDQLGAEIERQEQLGAAGPAANMIPMLKIYQKLLVASGDELQLAAVGIKTDDAGTVRVTTRMRLVPTGRWAATAGRVKETKKTLLAGLPEGPFVAAGGIQYSEPLQDLARWFIDGEGAKLNPVLAKLSAEQLAKWSEVSGRLIADQDNVKFWVGATKPDEPLLAATVIVAKVADSKKYFADLEELNKLRLTLVNDAKISPAFGEVRRFQIDGYEALEIVGDINQIQGLQDSPAAAPAKAILAKFLGSDDKIHTYTVAIDEQTVISAYVSEDQLRRAIAAIKASDKTSSAAGAQGKEVALLLPTGAQAVALVQPSGIADWVQSLRSIDKEGKRSSLEFPPSPPIGLALKISATGVHGEAVIQGPVLEALGKIVPLVAGSR